MDGERTPTIAGLYELYGKKIYNLAYRMTGDRALSEDILQEVFLLVLKNLDRFRGDSAVYTWIYAIAKNVCVRARQKSFQSFEKLIRVAAEPKDAQGFNDREKLAYINDVKDGCLTGLLTCLPFRQRAAFILRVLYEIPSKIVAQAMNKSENSIRILVSRAKANLKAFLCRNCSLFDGRNPCRCENMIRFSLAHSLIPRDNRASAVSIESELKEFRDEVMLYRSLPEKESPPDFLARLLGRKDLVILSRKKVK
jgi:RNA polymerase sigma factor (sigma-70 family)